MRAREALAPLLLKRRLAAKAVKAAWLLLLVLVASGCSRPEAAPEPPAAPGPDPQPPQPTGPPQPAQGTIEGFVRDADGPVPDALVQAAGRQARADQEGGFRLDVPAGTHVVNASDAAGRSVERAVHVAADDTSFVFLTLPDAEAPPAEEPAPTPQPRPGGFECPDGRVQEPHPTFGQDAELAWAALKTGFRAIVAWQGSAPSTESIQYSVGGQPYQSLSETAPRTSHLFVVDNLPVGKTFCFQVPGHPTHAMRLSNAGTGVDADGVYTTNLVVLANEGSDRAVLEAGFDDFAQTLWDATDGWVRLGNVFVVYDDLENHNSGWATCYIPGLSTPLCHYQYDVIFTLDAHPGGAASTYRDGISDPEAAMWMNWYWQAHPGSSVVSLDDPGNVLTHEMGHYMLGMQDMYAPAGSTNSGDCWDPATQISIMGGNRDATEYDDEVNRCPNEAAIVQDWGQYEPAWTSMVERYPTIPQRTGPPDPGPTGHGGAYALHVLDALPV